MTTIIEDRPCACGHFYGNHLDPEPGYTQLCEQCGCPGYTPGEPLEGGTQVPAGLELASNYHQSRAHYSDNLSTERAHYVGGRVGEALCSTMGNYLDVFDDAEHTGMAQSWSAHKPKPVASLPLCKRCKRKAAKTGEVSA